MAQRGQNKPPVVELLLSKSDWRLAVQLAEMCQNAKSTLEAGYGPNMKKWERKMFQQVIFAKDVTIYVKTFSIG